MCLSRIYWKGCSSQSTLPVCSIFFPNFQKFDILHQMTTIALEIHLLRGQGHFQAWSFWEATKAIASMPLVPLVSLKCSYRNVQYIVTGCPLPRRKCLGALALTKTKHMYILQRALPLENLLVFRKLLNWAPRPRPGATEAISRPFIIVNSNVYLLTHKMADKILCASALHIVKWVNSKPC